MLSSLIALRSTAAAAAATPAFVQQGTPASFNSSQSLTHAYTCALSPGSNRLLVFCAGINVSEDPTSFVSATYNGVALSTAHFVRNTSTAPDRVAVIYYLLHSNIPNDGASHNFVVDYSGTTAATAKVVALEYINVAQGAPHRVGQQTASGDGTIDLLTVTANSLLIDCMNQANASATSTPGTNQNERADLNGSNTQALFVSDKLPAGHAGGTVNMSQDSTQTSAQAYVAVAWEPA